MSKLMFARGDKIASLLEDHLNKMQSTHLDLSKNNLGKRSVDELIEMLGVLANSKVESLDLSSTGLQNMKSADLIKIIHALDNTPLYSINLSGNWLGLKKTGIELNEVLNAFNQTGIKELNLSANCLGNLKLTELKSLANTMKNSKIDKIQLDYNQFHKIGGALFVADLLFSILGKKAMIEEPSEYALNIRKRLGDLYKATKESRCENKHGFFNTKNIDEKPSKYEEYVKNK